MSQASSHFEATVGLIGALTFERHSDKKQSDVLLEHAAANLPFIRKTIRELPILAPEKRASALVISGGPSLRNKKTISRIVQSGYKGTVIAADAAYVACLREGLIPDFLVTLDPHRTRMVRWFGDPDLEQNLRGDDYFERQDLDVEFRKNAVETNSRNIAMVDQFAPRTTAIVASTAPPNVTARLMAAKFDIYWWNPLVDDPRQPQSITRRLYDINGLPSFNTGGNVGSASWVFAAAKLKVPRIGLAGMDLGYYHDTPHKMTQHYADLVRLNGSEDGLDKFFAEFVYPASGEKFYTDPTYFWYRQNLLQMLERSPCRTYNCTEGGTLFSEKLPCVSLDEFISHHG